VGVRRAIVLLLVCGLAAMRTATAGAAADQDLGRYLVQDPGDPLLAYAWDEGPETPSLFATREVWLDYGELGTDPDASVYLPFNEGTGAHARDLAATARRLELKGRSWVRGRFGWALDLAGPGELVLENDGRPFFPDAFTLELWLHRAEGAAAAAVPLVAEPGSFALALDPEGHVVAELRTAAGPVSVRGAAPAPGRWTHVAVAGDAVRFGHLRVTVDGELARARVAGAVARGAGRLALGASGAGVALDELRLLARALPTSELVEHARPGPSPGEHRRRLRFASGTREERPWAGIVREPALTDAGLARGALRRVVADASGARWVPGHWERSPARRGPAPRTTHPTVYVGGHRAWLFGGEVRDSHAPPMVNTNDTWLYDIAARRWEPVATDRAPSPRCHLPAAWSPDHDLVLLVGGWLNAAPEKRVLGDIWAFRVGARRWEARRPTGDAPPPQSDAGLVYHPGLRRFLLFNRATVREYDPEADRWTRRPEAEVVDANGRPARRVAGVSPIMGHDPETGLVVRFGGAYDAEGERRYTDETALYDAARNRWTVLRPEPAPSARVRAGFAYDTKRRRFVLFGGVRDQFSERFDDLWTFEVAARRWTRVEASNGPSPRGGYYGMAYDPERDEFVLLAGRHSPERFLDEAWHLSLDPAAGGSARFVFDRAAQPEADRLWVDAPGAGVTLRLAASADNASWGPPSDAPALPPDAGARYLGVEALVPPGASGVGLRALGLAAGAPPCAGRPSCRVLELPPYRGASDAPSPAGASSPAATPPSSDAPASPSPSSDATASSSAASRASGEPADARPCARTKSS
jgi:hypothetical protein